MTSLPTEQELRNPKATTTTTTTTAGTAGTAGTTNNTTATVWDTTSFIRGNSRRSAKEEEEEEGATNTSTSIIHNSKNPSSSSSSFVNYGAIEIVSRAAENETIAAAGLADNTNSIANSDYNNNRSGNRRRDCRIDNSITTKATTTTTLSRASSLSQINIESINNTEHYYRHHPLATNHTTSGTTGRSGTTTTTNKLNYSSSYNSFKELLASTIATTATSPTTATGIIESPSFSANDDDKRPTDEPIDDDKQQPRAFSFAKATEVGITAEHSPLLPPSPSPSSSLSMNGMEPLVQQQHREANNNQTTTSTFSLQTTTGVSSAGDLEEEEEETKSDTTKSPPPPTAASILTSDTTTTTTTTNTITENTNNDTTTNSTTNNSTTNNTNTTMILNNMLTRLLHQKTLSDTPLLTRTHPLLALLTSLSQTNSPPYTFPLLFLALYALLLLLYLPLYFASRVVTEGGVYASMAMLMVHGGRCLLRLLAFPGTNWKVYGEIELEFVRYSCKMLEGAGVALEDLGRGLLDGGGDGEGGGDENEWNLGDVPYCYKRVVLYRDRVLGVYWQVLQCLFDENGEGLDPLGLLVGGELIGGENDTNNGSGGGGSGTRFGFYNRLEPTVVACKRNLCCDRSSASTAAGNGQSLDGIQLGVTGINHHHDCNDSNNIIRNVPTTRYGNNPLMGDIGNMANLTPQARSDGKTLYLLLTTILEDLTTLESSCSNILTSTAGKSQLKKMLVSKESKEHAKVLIRHVGELRKFISGMKPPSSSGSGAGDDGVDEDDEQEVGADAVRHRLEENGTSSTASSSSNAVDVVKSAVGAFLSMVDPPPHKYIFGLDVIRGCLLARYCGARQFWVDRISGGGKIDVLMIPSLVNDESKRSSSVESSSSSMLPMSPRQGRGEDVRLTSTKAPSSGGGGKLGRKAVLYCNPNAGLAEVATGLGLIGGNIEQDKDGSPLKEATCWTEYYIEHGYDVYLFNYAGYGRSYGGSSCNRPQEEFTPGCFGALRRMLFSTFLAFKPSSESLKSDASTVARHLVEKVGVGQLIIHGESIGGMAAAGASRALTEKSSDNTVSLLICDRTFCNLEATAQRLVGSWTGNAIRLLTPSWSTDVASDFISSRCAKIVANDAADEIIHDYSSLKSGLSFAGELTKGNTNKAGWIMSAPLEYRVTDFENVSVTESKILSSSSCKVNPPTWPADKHITWKEAFHFAACVKRIGKLATAAKRRIPTNSDDLELSENDEEGIEVSCLSNGTAIESGGSNPQRTVPLEDVLLINLWNSLACCDGLCGHPLGHAVKEGFDCTVSWLCCVVVFGGQVVAEKAEKRWFAIVSSNDLNTILPEDFDLRPKGYQRDEDDVIKHPVPIPEIISTLKQTGSHKSQIKEVEVELEFITGMLEYIVQRLTSKENTALSLKRRNGHEDDQGSISTGCFLNLNCGHNNQYSVEERNMLMALIRRTCGDSV